MNKEKIIKFIFNVFTPLILGSIVGFITKNDFSYLESLNRKIVIPGFIFIIAWSILYLLQGIWYHLYLKKEENKKVITIYWISLLVNLLFTPFLFTLHLQFLALLDVVILMVLIGYLFFYSLNKKFAFAYLLLPYMLWLIVALSLMIDIVMHN